MLSLIGLIGKKSVSKRMMQGALKFQRLKDSDNGLLSNGHNFTCTQFVGALYEKLACISLNVVRCAKAAKKVRSIDNTFQLHFLHSTCSPSPQHYKLMMDTI